MSKAEAQLHSVDSKLQAMSHGGGEGGRKSEDSGRKSEDSGRARCQVCLHLSGTRQAEGLEPRSSRAPLGLPLRLRDGCFLVVVSSFPPHFFLL